MVAGVQRSDIQSKQVYLARATKHKRKEDLTISSLHVHLFDIKTDQHVLGNQTGLTYRRMGTPACCMQ